MPARRRAAAALAAFLLLPAAASAQAPSYTNVAGPKALVGDAAEPSIGYHPATDQVLFQSNLTTAKVDFTKSPPVWTDVTEPTAVFTADPILFTDRQTGRTFSSQLLLACSKAAYSDDDGGTWLPSQGCGAGTAVDHQTIGGGPYHAGALPAVKSPAYPNAVYYCAQASVTATCARSDNGGLTFGAGSPLYTAAQCAGLHGHLKVAPDGTAYVPNFDCADAKGDARQAAVTSTDNGTTWTVDTVPDSTTQDESDPHIGIGAKGTVYFGYEGAAGDTVKTDDGDRRTEGPAMIAVKPAGSRTWSRSVDVGAALGIKNIQFPEVVAGDDDRAAFAFLGTTTAGNDQEQPAANGTGGFRGTWHLYVATTYDAGRTWTTVDATPTDPVQRGCVWLGGGDVACRNLLDFNDITMDRQGRVLVAYADGCIDRCVTDAGDFTSKSSLGTIARQTGGRGLLAAYDSVLGTVDGTVGTVTSALSPADGTGQPFGGPLASTPFAGKQVPVREGSRAQERECGRTNGFRSLHVRARTRGRVKVSFRRAVAGRVTIDVLRLGAKTRRVKRFAGRRTGVTYRLPSPGRYAIVIAVGSGTKRDVRQVTVLRRGSKVRVETAARVAAPCERGEEEREREARKRD